MKNRITVAEYLTQQINLSGKSQVEIAQEVGYDKANVITMFKQGKTRLPINKAPAFAKALGVDPVHMLRLVMNEYSPETWAVIDKYIGKSLVTESEAAILDIVRESMQGQSLDLNEAERNALKTLADGWRTRADAHALGAAERVARSGNRTAA